MDNKQLNQADFQEPVISGLTWISVLMAVAFGALLAAVLLPAWLPGLTTSLLGPAPKAYWYLSRGSALVAYALLWLSMVFGLLITNKMARAWPGGPAAFDLHEYASLLGLAFGLFHALILLGDHYINYNIAQILVPFASAPYRPFWVGLGQLGFYISIIVSITFYARKQLGGKTWRVIHFASFLSFLMALLHGITSGTDSASTWAAWMYWISGGSLLFLLMYRILVSVIGSHEKLQSPRTTVQKQA